MRLTINLKSDLYAVARSLAQAEGVSISEAVNRLLRRAIEQPGAPRRRARMRSGFPVARGRRAFGPDDVKRIDSLS